MMPFVVSSAMLLMSSVKVCNFFIVLFLGRHRGPLHKKRRTPETNTQRGRRKIKDSE